eukprot:TRINITY_DN2043_c0_g1_i1.p1 TRINITY_DN2043_c0_g1~~TRINITY_DN2043_c0_g1_i1.p1  ORF type:complete len:283 (-),score=66.78 TRINITY_DN2043_c0_g1_i1:60-908(-)
MDNSPQSDQRGPASIETPSTTLFVSGLDPEMSEGDFASLFQNCQGVNGTRIKFDKKDNLIGFVDFDSEENAVAIKNRFDNGKFQALSGSNYDVHFARATRNRQGADNSAGRGPRNNNRGNQGGYNDFGRGGRNQGNMGGYNNYNSMPYSGPYSGMGGGNSSLPPNAVSTLYVEGVAHDATDREVSHIFRPFPGFQSVRTSTRESRKYPDSTYLLCFVEFDNPHLATNAMQMLQGYKFDLNKKDGSRGLRISYAANSNKNNQRGGGRRDDGGNDDQGRDGDNY